MSQPADIAAALEAAVEAHRAGRLEEARAGYEAVLRPEPDQWRAAHNLAVLLLKGRDFDRALPLLRKAVEGEPAGGRSWVTLVQALINAERFAEGEAELAARPSAGDPQHASLEARLRQGWGMSLAGAGDLEGAEAQFRRVLALTPDQADAHADLGYILMRRDEAQGAEAALRRALELAPDHLQAILNLASARRTQGDVAAAEAGYRRAMTLDPTATAPARNLAMMYNGLGRHADMLALADELDAAEPSALAAMFRGSAFSAMRRFDEALASLDEAVARAPADTMARYRRGEVRLLLRDFERGWSDYDARWGNESFLTDSAGGIAPEVMSRLAHGARREDLVGRRVLLVAEQGLGDQIMFASILPDLIRDAAAVTCLSDRKLVRLLGHSFPQVPVLWRRDTPDLSAFDVVLPMGALGGIYRRRIEDFSGAPFLRPDTAVRDRWSERLGPRPPGLRIGLSWKGGTRNTRAANRSIPLAQLAPLLALPGCEFVSLQYGEVADELAAVNVGMAHPIRVFSADEVEDYEDVAGLVQNLDVVVSVQTALVHLCGAVGADCLTMIPYQAEWRYTAHSSTMPWYRSLTLLRQAEPGEWGPVIGQVTETLRERLRMRGLV